MVRQLVSLAAVATCLSAAPVTLISQPWGSDFSIRTNEAGDSISIGAAFSDGSQVWLHDLARGRVVRFDSSGRVAGAVTLESAGRAGYAGDDFVVRRDRILFLNTVDRRIEVFDAATGRHQGAIVYPADALAQEPKRSLRITNRVFLDSNSIVLGNERRAWYLDEVLGKRQEGRAAVKTVTGERLIGFARSRPLITGEPPARRGVLKCRAGSARSHFPIAGKRFLVVNDRLFVLLLEPTGFRIIAAP